MITPAPYRADLAEGPPNTEAVFVRADDGVRLRITVTEAGSAGTVLCFPGRTECAEKMGRLTRRLAECGLSTVIIDWRGQGFSDRLSADTMLGHVAQFEDYQLDVQAALDLARERDMPEPYHLLAHSMGGAIGLRALIEGLPVHSAVFSAPMWGLPLSRLTRWFGHRFGHFFTHLGIAERLAPTTDEKPYFLTQGFPDNMLTTDEDEWKYMAGQVVAEPRLGLGGPSLHWVYEAIKEVHWLEHQTPPELPALIGVGTNERIVTLPAIRHAAERWPSARLIEVDGAEHELLMEVPPRRDALLQPALELFLQTR